MCIQTVCRSLSIILIAVLASACTATIYGVTRDEWLAMSEEERQKAIAEHQEIVARKNQLAYPDQREEITKRFTARAVDRDPPYIAK